MGKTDDESLDGSPAKLTLSLAAVGLPSSSSSSLTFSLSPSVSLAFPNISLSLAVYLSYICISDRIFFLLLLSSHASVYFILSSFLNFISFHLCFVATCFFLSIFQFGCQSRPVFHLIFPSESIFQFSLL